MIMEEKGKKLGIWNIVGLGLGGAIGTGIFVMLGYGIATTGRSIMLVCAIGSFLCYSHTGITLRCLPCLY